MSGGPVISTQGEVVGIVSSSIAPYEGSPGVGFALELPRIPLNQIAPELDLGNPGFIVGFGVFKSGQITGFYPSEEIAKSAVENSQEFEIRKYSRDLIYEMTKKKAVPSSVSNSVIAACHATFGQHSTSWGLGLKTLAPHLCEPIGMNPGRALISSKYAAQCASNGC